MMKCVLSIAGSDSSGGAGIQADIKTITAHGLYAMTAIAALTAQNTLGVQGILEVPAEFVGQQLDSIFLDIQPDAVKIGMLANQEVVKVVAQKLQQYQAQNIVLDPVMVSTSGSTLLQDTAVARLRAELFPLATIITPNIPEAEVLSGFSIVNSQEMQQAARQIASYHASQHGNGPATILIKGGHLVDSDQLSQNGEAMVKDLLYINGEFQWFESRYIDNPNTHGTGCTLSSAIACNLALGHSISTAISQARNYLSDALAANLNLGAGKGPLNHTPHF
jgi:hydroxymethylpyrimidine/phosphomethylpyrimidine kinase